MSSWDRNFRGLLFGHSWWEGVIFIDVYLAYETSGQLVLKTSFWYSAVQFISRNYLVSEWKGMGLHLSYCCSIFWGWKTFKSMNATASINSININLVMAAVGRKSGMPELVKRHYQLASKYFLMTFLGSSSMRDYIIVCVVDWIQLKTKYLNSH